MRYPINEIFTSMQGEGCNAGMKVNFIRLAGCNLKCDFCDTHHEYFQMLHTSEIERKLDQSVRKVIITGGEPFIHNLLPLVDFLKFSGYWVGIETNGTIPIRQEVRRCLDYISVSPKEGTNILVLEADEVRVLSWATVNDLLKIQNRIEAKKYYISPIEINGAFDINSLHLLAEIREKFSDKWSLSIQLHKVFNFR